MSVTNGLLLSAFKLKLLTCFTWLYWIPWRPQICRGTWEILQKYLIVTSRSKFKLLLSSRSSETFEFRFSSTPNNESEWSQFIHKWNFILFHNLIDDLRHILRTVYSITTQHCVINWCSRSQLTIQRRHCWFIGIFNILPPQSSSEYFDFLSIMRDMKISSVARTIISTRILDSTCCCVGKTAGILL